MKAISGTLVIAGLALILIALVIFMGPRFGRPFTIWEESWTIATSSYSSHILVEQTRWCGTYLNPNTNIVIYSSPEQIAAFNAYGANANLFIQATQYPQVMWNYAPELFTAYDPSFSSANPNIIVARTGINFDRSAESNCRFRWDITFNQAPPTVCPTQDIGNCVYGSEVDSSGCFIKCQEPPLGTTPPPAGTLPPPAEPIPDNSGMIAIIIILIFVLGIVYLKIR